MNSVRDFFWVLQAFIRGKVLRQKNYCPRNNMFPRIHSANVKRLIKLMNWWGFRPMTKEELHHAWATEKKWEARGASHVPYVHYWTDRKIELYWDTNQNGLDRFISIRRE